MLNQHGTSKSRHRLTKGCAQLPSSRLKMQLELSGGTAIHKAINATANAAAAAAPNSGSSSPVSGAATKLKQHCTVSQQVDSALNRAPRGMHAGTARTLHRSGSDSNSNGSNSVIAVSPVSTVLASVPVLHTDRTESRDAARTTRLRKGRSSTPLLLGTGSSSFRVIAPDLLPAEVI
jgi:hypothetical protein